MFKRLIIDPETNASIKLEQKKYARNIKNQDTTKQKNSILEILLLIIVISPWLYFLANLAVFLVSLSVGVSENTSLIILKSIKFIQVTWIGVPLLLMATLGVAIICTIKPVIRGVMECSISFVGCCYSIIVLIPSVGTLFGHTLLVNDTTQVSALVALATSGLVGSSGASLIINEKKLS